MDIKNAPFASQLAQTTPKLPNIDDFTKPSAGKTSDEVREVAEKFESVFLSQMMQHMMTDIETDGLFGGGHGEKMFRSLLVEEYATSTAKRGGVGIADAVYRELMRQQEMQQAPQTSEIEEKADEQRHLG
ncbi:rod-binding protein [Telmatospirillum sp. J64-1]|uniref:rod-binding protein n=1 Tax=Telmatospirillum sp. J64-1 TaxID=2502183 RepID=UPI00115EACE3|nr:rod-binding protein [Telmatospirillum sp. J64-1]